MKRKPTVHRARNGSPPQSTMPQPEDFPQRRPGEPVRLNWKKQVLRFACCDCALVHNIRFTVTADTITLMAWRNDKLTKHFRNQTGKDGWAHLLGPNKDMHAQPTT